MLDDMTDSKISPDILAKLGPRAVYGQFLLETALKDSKVVALSADLGNSSGLERFKNSLPERFIDVGIAEQQLVAMSAGLAKEGFIPFASSFAPFLSLRAAEQVRMNLGYMNLNVKLVALGSGVSMGFLGNSHYGLEDLAVMRSIPNITILTPSDGIEIKKSIEIAREIDGPVYIRLTGIPGMGVLHEKDFQVKIGEPSVWNGNQQIAILSHGYVTQECYSSVLALKKLGIGVTLYAFMTIAPLDIRTIEKIASEHTKLLIVEEHFKIGGLSSAISEIELRHGLKSKFYQLSLGSAYGPTGEYRFLLDHHGLSSAKIVDKIMKLMND